IISHLEEKDSVSIEDMLWLPDLPPGTPIIREDKINVNKGDATVFFAIGIKGYDPGEDGVWCTPTSDLFESESTLSFPFNYADPRVQCRVTGWAYADARVFQSYNIVLPDSSNAYHDYIYLREPKDFRKALQIGKKMVQDRLEGWKKRDSFAGNYHKIDGTVSETGYRTWRGFVPIVEIVFATEPVPLDVPRIKLKPKKKRVNRMYCCDSLSEQNGEILRQLRMISQATGANKLSRGKGIQLPGSSFLDDGDPDLSKLLSPPRFVRSIPDMIWYFIDQLDGFYGEWPFKLKIPDHLVEAARKSGEVIPTEIKVWNVQDAFEECLKLAFNLQDDEATIKELGKRAILEAHLARQEAATAKAMCRTLIEWTGMGYKEKMSLLRANFTIPGITDQLANVVPGLEGAMSIDAWDTAFDDKDKELEKFLQVSNIPIKTLELDRSKDDLMVSLLILRQIASIIKHAHTASLDYQNIEDNLEKYVRDFDKKARKGASETKEQLKAQGRYVEPDEAEDPDRLKDLKKWASYAEAGYSPKDNPSFVEDRRTSNRDDRDQEPFGRTYNERPKIEIKKQPEEKQK
ncbi:hypothetical protein, partial [Roseofilum sp. Belize Diploria]|uniref:hypothetical protein n=1 Tax=Roseofilum sp. Belize Diploria TaxID=2821501 RepID=UPI001B19F873